mmetsp:Transcript_43091/g.41435  ORF Transcript_43091/g.41435 Transcript_43091/m.41435 type:complete len:87 (+) Transcript_43091:754-1014(+)
MIDLPFSPRIDEFVVNDESYVTSGRLMPDVRESLGVHKDHNKSMFATHTRVDSKVLPGLNVERKEIDCTMISYGVVSLRNNGGVSF